jgi:3-hydroxy-3-methylglutaryl CoA synthase
MSRTAGGAFLATSGITGFGAYVPRLRIGREIIADAHRWMAPSLRGQARGSRAFCSWDEDAITMAVEAGRDCLRGGNAPPQALMLASTTLPYADLQNGVIVSEALGLPAATRAIDVAHSQRCGTSALLAALDGSQNTLVIASDKPTGKPASVQELAYGAGAAAISVGGGAVLARLLGAASVSRGMVDHFRPAGAAYDYFWEERWIRDEGYARIIPEAVAPALASAGVSIKDVSHFLMPSLQRGAAESVAKALGFAGVVAPGLEDGCGYAGAAHSLLLLASCLENAKPSETILLVGFGQGADAMVFQATEALASYRRGRGVSGSLADGVATDSYLRLLSFAGGIELEWGMRAEKTAKTALTEQYRSASQIASFVAARCGRCGTMQFPQLEYCVNQACRAPAEMFEPVSLVDEAFEVLTYTADWLSYHPAPPLYVGFVQFDNGARLLMEVVDVGAAGIDVGTKLRAVFRIKERDRVRGYNRYFWKATPIAA